MRRRIDAYIQGGNAQPAFENGLQAVGQHGLEVFGAEKQLAANAQRDRKGADLTATNPSRRFQRDRLGMGLLGMSDRDAASTIVFVHVDLG